MSQRGQISRFDPNSDDWVIYCEQLEQHFLAYDVAEDKHVPMLLSSLPADVYTALRAILSPDIPSSKTYAEIKTTLTEYLKPKRSVFTQRYEFHQRDQREDEPVMVYITELKRISEGCEYAALRDEFIRDRLIFGIKDEEFRKKLLAKDESTLTLAKAQKLAVAYENASKDSRALESATTSSSEMPQVGLNKVKNASSKPGNRFSQKCKHCGRNNHLSVNCRFKNAECYACGTRGHTRNVCPKPETLKSNRKPMHLIDDITDSRPSSSDDVDCLELYHMNKQRTETFWVTVSINGRDIKMEVDTGAAISILPSHLFKKHFAQLPLLKTDVKLKTYSGAKMIPEGILEVNVAYGDQKQRLRLYVVDTPGPPLFGREWMYVIKLDWKSFFSAHCIEKNGHPNDKVSRNLNHLLDEFKDLFEDGIGKLKGPKAKLVLKEGSQPKFLPARPVPYALRPKVESELQQLEEAGVLTKVQTSDWATPIVPVVK